MLLTELKAILKFCHFEAEKGLNCNTGPFVFFSGLSFVKMTGASISNALKIIVDSKDILSSRPITPSDVPPNFRSEKL